MKIEESIKLTRQRFEESFIEEKFYNKQTSDDKHLDLIFELINPVDGNVILDLGTGNGYVAFPLAWKNSGIKVISMDIVCNTIKRNTEKSIQKEIKNLSFISYDGETYPFNDNTLDTIIVRYALHHFPNIIDSFLEMYRVLKAGGKLIISDPTPNNNDNDGFVDKFMQMKLDGHIKFYSFKEYKNMLEEVGFQFLTQKGTIIRFPRKEPVKYKKLLEMSKEDIISGYNIEVTDEEIWITENVLNMVFRKEQSNLE